MQENEILDSEHVPHDDVMAVADAVAEEGPVASMDMDTTDPVQRAWLEGFHAGFTAGPETAQQVAEIHELLANLTAALSSLDLSDPKALLMSVLG